MKAVLLSLGTRGDIEPFLAIAQKLKNLGYGVVCAFPAQFRSLVPKEDYDFFGLSEKFLELVEGEQAQMVLGGKGNVFQKMKALAWMIKNSQSMQKEVIIQQHDLLEKEKPEIVIYNQKCLYPVVWGIKNPGATTLLSPVPCTIHEFDGHAALGMGRDLGRFLNRMTYRFSNFFLFQTIHHSTKKYYQELGLRITPSKIGKHLLREEPMIYTISPSLFPRPHTWGENVQVVGHHEYKRPSTWKPSKALLSFLGRYQKPIFITFGSMINPDPRQKTQAILSVLSKHNIPAIINTASGGLVCPSEYRDHVFFTENIPYEWIFPKVYAVVHHGGSGTTHLAVKNGCASLILPHILDQHIWNDLIFRLGIGPDGISIKKFTASRFEKKLLDLLEKPAYRSAAEVYGKKISSEQLDEYLLEMVT